MTESQALELARKVYDETLRLRRIEPIKEALMEAYNDGWENGFEEGAHQDGRERT
jgi:hypothetical protein